MVAEDVSRLSGLQFRGEKEELGGMKGELWRVTHRYDGGNCCTAQYRTVLNRMFEGSKGMSDYAVIG